MKKKIGILSIILSIFIYIALKIAAAIMFAGADTGISNQTLYTDIIRMYFLDLCVLCALTFIAGVSLIIWHFANDKHNKGVK